MTQNLYQGQFQLSNNSYDDSILTQPYQQLWDYL